MSSGYSPVSTCTVQSPSPVAMVLLVRVLSPSPCTGYARVPPTVQSPVVIVLLVRAVSSGYSPASRCSLHVLVMPVSPRAVATSYPRVYPYSPRCPSIMTHSSVRSPSDDVHLDVDSESMYIDMR